MKGISGKDASAISIRISLTGKLSWIFLQYIQRKSATDLVIL